jgi:hypothetical protein
MVISYVRDEIPGWRAYVDHMSTKGKRFFMTGVVYNEVMVGLSSGEAIPAPFHRFDDGEGEIRARSAVPKILKAFGIPEDSSSAGKFANDLQWLLQSGYSISGCPDIPEIEIVCGRALAITANAKLVRRFLYTPGKRTTFELVVDQSALEHLADIRTVKVTTGTYVDRSAF